MAMRVVGVASYQDDDDDGGLAKVRRYNEYIDSIRPGLPSSVSALVDVSVHDSHVVSWDLSDARRFQLTFVTENIVENVSRISLAFSDADVVANDTDPIETLRLLDGGTELLTSEFDVVAEGRYRFQVMMTPTGELAVTFSDVEIKRSPATIEEWRELGRRPNTGRWGREADAWLDDLPRLHRAAAFGQQARVRALLDSGSPIDEVDKDTGWQALHAAAIRVRLEVMNVLLEYGADVDALDSEGRSPLSIAARDEDWRGVELLIKAGANPNLGNDLYLPLDQAAGAGNAEALRLLIAAGGDPQHRAADGWTVLMTAAETGDLKLIEVLLGAGADPNATANDGRSAADLARAQGRLESARLLDNAASSRR